MLLTQGLDTHMALLDTDTTAAQLTAQEPNLADVLQSHHAGNTGEEAKHLAEVASKVVSDTGKARKPYKGEARKHKAGMIQVEPITRLKDRSNGGTQRLAAVQMKQGDAARNPKGINTPYGTTDGKPSFASIRKVRSLYAREGFSPEEVAGRMTAWLQLPYGKAVEKMNNDKTQLFERLGISILIHATEAGDTQRLDKLLDRIIGRVVERSETQVQSLNVTAQADIDLLKRIQLDLKHKPIPQPVDDAH